MVNIDHIKSLIQTSQPFWLQAAAMAAEWAIESGRAHPKLAQFILDEFSSLAAEPIDDISMDGWWRHFKDSYHKVFGY